MLEFIRQVIFTGTPELYDKGGITGSINMRAKEAFEKYCLKGKDGLASLDLLAKSTLVNHSEKEGTIYEITPNDKPPGIYSY